MNFYGFKEMCRIAWIEIFNCLCNDMIEKMMLIIVFLREAKTHT